MMRIVALIGAALTTSPTWAVELGVDGTHFTLDGEPTFLLGVSYYGGCARTPELMARDLDDLRARGINWVRVWATWDMYDTTPAVDTAGAPQEPAISALRELVSLADARGMVVDVTLHRGGVLTTDEAHLAAVRTIARELRRRRNVYIDVANERDVRDNRYVSPQECRALRDAIREIDPARLVTASCTFGSAQELAEFLEVTQLDFITPHLPRNADDPAKTQERVERYLAWMQETGRIVPVHLQEPFRRDYGAWQPDTEDFLTDLRGAVAGGAAGWCLHNGSNRHADDGEPRRSFDLHEGRGPFLDTLDEVERAVLEAMAGVAGGG
ncbi:MAG: cellulase family glycosylhydrolase [Armatimonadota bacterium]